MTTPLQYEERYPAIFWRPGDAKHEHPIAGLLWLESDGLPMVQLHESLTDSFFGPLNGSDNPDWLHGQIIGRAVTLRGLRLRSSQQGIGKNDPARVQYAAHRAYIGRRWLDEEDELFDQARVRFWDQDGWIGLNLVEQIMPTQDHGVVIRGLRPAPLILPCSDAALRVEDATGFSGTAVHPALNMCIDLPTPTTYGDLLDSWLYPLQFLLISSTGKRSGISYLRVSNPAWREEVGEGPLRADWLQVHFRVGQQPQPNTSSITMLYQLSDFLDTGEFPSGYDFKQVFTAAHTNRFAIDQYASIQSEQTGGYTTTFIAATQAAEALDRVAHPDAPAGDEDEWARRIKNALKALGANRTIRESASYGARHSYRPSLEGRLNRLDFDTGRALSEIFNSKTWASDLARARNVVAHGLEETELLGRDVRGIQVATTAYLLLIELRWLTLIGFTPERARELSERRANFWQIRKQLQDGAEHIRVLASRLSDRAVRS